MVIFHYHVRISGVHFFLGRSRDWILGNWFLQGHSKHRCGSRRFGWLWIDKSKHRSPIERCWLQKLLKQIILKISNIYSLSTFRKIHDFKNVQLTKCGQWFFQTFEEIIYSKACTRAAKPSPGFFVRNGSVQNHQTSHAFMSKFMKLLMVPPWYFYHTNSRKLPSAAAAETTRAATPMLFCRVEAVEMIWVFPNGLPAIGLTHPLSTLIATMAEISIFGKYWQPDIWRSRFWRSSNRELGHIYHLKFQNLWNKQIQITL